MKRQTLFVIFAFSIATCSQLFTGVFERSFVLQEQLLAAGGTPCTHTSHSTGNECPDDELITGICPNHYHIMYITNGNDKDEIDKPASQCNQNGCLASGIPQRNYDGMGCEVQYWNGTGWQPNRID